MSDLRVVPGITGVHNVCKHIARYNMALDSCNSKRVLDAACGVGYGTRIISMVAREVVGWDIDQTAIDQAMTEYNARNSAYYCVDIENIGNKREIGAHSPFDTIVSLETIEHVNDPEALIANFSELLVPGGFLVASVPLNEVKGSNEHHQHVYTLETAKELFTNFHPITELVQHGLSFYPTQFCDQFPNDNVYYLFAGIKS